MSCPEYKAEIIEAARGWDSRPVRQHLDSCRACSDFFDEQMALTDSVRSLAARHEVWRHGEVETQLLKELNTAWPAKSTRRRWIWAPVAVAAAVLMTIWLYPKPAVPHAKLPAPPQVTPIAQVDPPSTVQPPHRIRKRPAPEDPVPFIPIPYTIPLAPYERAQVMQVELPVAELIAAGLPISTTDQGALARADVLVGDDGRARAVRVISISERSMER